MLSLYIYFSLDTASCLMRLRLYYALICIRLEDKENQGQTHHGRKDLNYNIVQVFRKYRVWLTIKLIILIRHLHK